MGQEKKVPVEAISRATRILEVLSSHGHLGVRQIAAQLGEDPATVHRALTTLEEARFVTREPVAGKFVIAPHFFELAQRGLRHYSLITCAGPHLWELHRLTGEIVFLGVPADGDLLFVERVPLVGHPATGGVQIASRPGYRGPLHATAAGKAYLAALPPAEVSRVLAQIGLARATAATISEPEQLLAALEQVRRDGFALNDEEFRPGARGVGACIRGPRGPIAMLSLVGPIERITRDRIPTLGAQVRATAQRISQGLGATLAFEAAQP